MYREGHDEEAMLGHGWSGRPKARGADPGAQPRDREAGTRHRNRRRKAGLSLLLHLVVSKLNRDSLEPGRSLAETPAAAGKAKHTPACAAMTPTR